MMTEDIESIAGEILQCAKLDGHTVPKAGALVRGTLGTDRLFTVHARSLPGDAALARVNDEWRIYVRLGLPPARRRWAICHELAEWWLAKESVRDPMIEHYADTLAAALVVPRPAFQRAMREMGERYGGLAARFETSESCMALRYGEVTGTPLALITPTTVRVRGELFYWGTETHIRKLARKPKLPGVQKVKLRDAPRRLALLGT